MKIKDMEALIVRNKRIIELRRAGKSYGQIAKEIDLTRQRIHMICVEEAEEVNKQ